MTKILKMQNPIKEYAWGSRTAIAELLGEASPSPVPQAEMWMGAHPSSPSRVQPDGRGEDVPLGEWIAESPAAILGPGVSARHGGKLPFLMKVLAAAEPLSIQAHPDLEQAREGFARENRLGIPLDAPHRNYRDANHKPELICAVTPFWAMKGFRPPEEARELLAEACGNLLQPELSHLRTGENQAGIKLFFEALMAMDKARAAKVVNGTLGRIRRQPGIIPEYEWLERLAEKYPGDAGVLSPLFLNLIPLQKDEALYLGARELHAYLEGVGIEIMANSDNVLRGGLTPKHVDVPELLSVLRFEQSPVKILKPVEAGPGEWVYPAPSEEFSLSIVRVEPDNDYVAGKPRSLEMLLCMEGRAEVREAGSGLPADLPKGGAVVIPADVGGYSVKGGAKLYKASIPFESENAPAR